MEAEKTLRRLTGKADMPKLATALRRLDLFVACAGAQPAPKQAADVAAARKRAVEDARRSRLLGTRFEACHRH